MAAFLLLKGGAASAGYVAIDLYPLVGPSGYPGAAPQQASGGSVVGFVAQTTGSNIHPGLWLGDGRPVDLTPPGYHVGVALGTDGRHQVGSDIPITPPNTGSAAHAMLWAGTPASAIDLNPTSFFFSEALGVGGGAQVGDGAADPAQTHKHALLWHGTADSAIDLHPAGLDNSKANGTNGSQQVGDGEGPATNFYTHALLWTGSANSMVDLQPVNLPGIDSSSANATNGRQQVGVGNPGTRSQRALLWSGTAGSAIDLHPAGYEQSDALGLNDTSQVGWGIINSGSYHALLWGGTADSAIDLHPLLPGSFGTSIAYTIDASGDVFGIASDQDHQLHAVEWLPHPVLPGDVDLNGTVDFSDLLALAQHYGQSGGWVNGDFNEDGTVNFADLLMLAQNYGRSLGSSAVAASVPEPLSALWLVGMAGCARRRR